MEGNAHRERERGKELAQIFRVYGEITLAKCTMVCQALQKAETGGGGGASIFVKSSSHLLSFDTRRV